MNIPKRCSSPDLGAKSLILSEQIGGVPRFPRPFPNPSGVLPAKSRTRSSESLLKHLLQDTPSITCKVSVLEHGGISDDRNLALADLAARRCACGAKGTAGSSGIRDRDRTGKRQRH